MTVDLEIIMPEALGVIADIEVGGFIWSDEREITVYLDADSVIKIGETYSMADAIRIENNVVRMIIGYLGDVYEISEKDKIPYLRVATAMLVASELGFAKFGSTMGNPLTSWASRLEENAWAMLVRCYISQSLPLIKKSVPYVMRLLNSKQRRSMRFLRYE